MKCTTGVPESTMVFFKNDHFHQPVTRSFWPSEIAQKRSHKACSIIFHLFNCIPAARRSAIAFFLAKRQHFKQLRRPPLTQLAKHTHSNRKNALRWRFAGRNREQPGSMRVSSLLRRMPHLIHVESIILYCERDSL